MKNNTFCLIAFLLLSCITGFAQDYHLSQFDASPLYLNPALVGERTTIHQGIRISGVYRDQSAQYTQKAGSYRTASIGIDFPVNERFSVGQYFGNNKSVDGAFNTFNFSLSGSYKIIGPRESNDQQNLSVGLQLGVLNSSVNTTNFTYEAQYSASADDGFDRTLPTGEPSIQQSVFRYDANIGLYYRTKFVNDRLTLNSGVSLYHVGKRNDATTLTSKPPMRLNFHAGATYVISDKFDIKPQFLYMNQAKSDEVNVGVLLHYKQKADNEPIIGVNWIVQKAAVFQVGMRLKSSTFRLSYCVATNYLSRYSNRGIEVSWVFIASKKFRDIDHLNL